MKAYFIRLFGYDRFANDIILETMLKAGSPDKPVKLMAHLLAAQQVWLNRCKGSPLPMGPLWPDRSAETLVDTIAQNSAGWLAYLDSLQAGDMDKLIDYKDSRGNSHRNKLSDVLAHVINHGTHHRAQAGQQIKAAGVTQLPLTDYIFYVRTLNEQ
jgi:uncharacterized damage-inducible protein DinB